MILSMCHSDHVYCAQSDVGLHEREQFHIVGAFYHFSSLSSHPGFVIEAREMLINISLVFFVLLPH